MSRKSQNVKACIQFSDNLSRPKSVFDFLTTDCLLLPKEKDQLAMHEELERLDRKLQDTTDGIRRELDMFHRSNAQVNQGAAGHVNVAPSCEM